jgi:CheY-like chemotaxis protein
MKGRILIADSDEDVRFSLQSLLTAAGYMVSLAVDGVSLIEHALSDQPDLIMIDSEIPAGNAERLIEILRQFPAFARTPVFVSASREHRMCALQIYGAGANAFVPKPFNRQVLLSLLARFLPAENRPLLPSASRQGGPRADKPPIEWARWN